VSGNYRPSDYFGANPWGGIAVSIQADDFSGDQLWVRNGFDNCIGVSRIDPTNQRAKPGLPQRFTLSNIHTENCGSGRHSVERGGPGRIGAGIDNGSGSAGVIENVVDFRSYGSFIADIGAGAYASWSNLTSFYSRVDERKDTPALYVGAPYNSFTNVEIIAPEGRGVWSDRYASGSLFANVTIKSADGPCLFIKGGAQWSNVRRPLICRARDPTRDLGRFFGGPDCRAVDSGLRDYDACVASVLRYPESRRSSGRRRHLGSRFCRAGRAAGRRPRTRRTPR
jgi:hypothetical protein